MQEFLVKLHKKGDIAGPRHYRQIYLQSQAQKSIEAAIDMLIRTNYTKSPVELGCLEDKSAEFAILRATELQHRGKRCIGAVDLSAAYDTVPRGFRIQRVGSVLPPSVYGMAEAL